MDGWMDFEDGLGSVHILDSASKRAVTNTQPVVRRSMRAQTSSMDIISFRRPSLAFRRVCCTDLGEEHTRDDTGLTCAWYLHF